MSSFPTESMTVYRSCLLPLPLLIQPPSQVKNKLKNKLQFPSNSMLFQQYTALLLLFCCFLCKFNALVLF